MIIGMLDCFVKTAIHLTTIFQIMDVFVEQFLIDFVANTIDIMMQKASLDKYLEFYISNQDVTHGKPNPEMYNKAIDRMGLDPKECMIVEDNENGIKAARASGAHVMIVQSVEDVNYENIQQHLRLFEGEMQ